MGWLGGYNLCLFRALSNAVQCIRYEQRKPGGAIHSACHFQTVETFNKSLCSMTSMGVKHESNPRYRAGGSVCVLTGPEI